MSYSYSGNLTQKEISEIDTLSYTVDVLGGDQYQFSVRAVTIKRGPDASLNAEVPEYSEFGFHFKHIIYCKYMYFVFADIHLGLQM